MKKAMSEFIKRMKKIFIEYETKWSWKENIENTLEKKKIYFWKKLR